ncbi:MAG: hypothetical protein JHC93_03275 [Parachlamydiales bacterium]|nr:hypothetical protein [Parachlamydiales bacterium]
MKKLLLMCALGVAPLFGYDSLEQQPLLDKLAEAVLSMESPPHWTVVLKGVQVANAKFKTSDVRYQDLLFNEADGDLYFTFAPTSEETVTFGAGWGHTTLKWDENPFFSQTNFDVVKLGVIATTDRFTDWFWQGSIYTNRQSNKIGSSNDAIYTTEVWGRWSVTEAFGLNFGFINQLGLKTIELYPIIGFDYRANCNWKINLVYPTNISVNYDFADHWTASASARFFKTRHRVDSDQAVPFAIFQYQTVGGELALAYDIQFFRVKLFGGSTTEARLKIYNSNGNDRTEYKLDPAFYAGMNISVHF